MWFIQTASMQTILPLSQPIETKFLCLGTEREVGSLLDGWRVVWCQPDRNGIVWHIYGRPGRDPVSRLLRATTMSRQIGILTLRNPVSISFT